MKVDTSMALGAQAAQQAMGPAAAAVTGGAAPGGAEFVGKVREAMGSLVEEGRQADQAVMDLMAGGPADLHTSMIKMQEADIGLRFAVQVRNRAISAYEEIMRLQV